MAPNCLTVLAPIRPGDEDALRTVLRATGDDIRGRRAGTSAGPRIDFPRSRHIHFARFAILRDPDRGPDRARLLFATAYDGDLDGHLAELVAITTDLDGIWGKCEGYAAAGGFAAFVRAHAHEPAAFYAAFRDEHVGSIQRATAAPLDSWRAVPRSLPARVLARIRQFARAAPIVADVVRAIGQYGLANVYRGTLRITASLNRYTFFRIVNRLTHNEMSPQTSPSSSVALDHCAPPAPLSAGDEVAAGSSAPPPGFREDVVVQNQLTLVTVLPQAEAERVRAVMSAIDSYARRLSPPGSLIGISTIHFVRWLLIDEGRRLMMVSDYDGSWENYIDEFAEMIVSGLDAIWETAAGYAPGGARDLPAFKRFLRIHQVPSEVFFSAYPNATVLNILAGTALVQGRR